jgi:hypothetical protein
MEDFDRKDVFDQRPKEREENSYVSVWSKNVSSKLNKDDKKKGGQSK